MWVEWVKALHVISVIAWMAGMLYLPRLFVYHAEAQRGSIQSDTFKIYSSTAKKTANPLNEWWTTTAIVFLDIQESVSTGMALGDRRYVDMFLPTFAA